MQGKIIITGAKAVSVPTSRSSLPRLRKATVAASPRNIQQTTFRLNFAAYPADITQPQPTRELVTKVIAKYGRIDVLVHVMGGFAAGKIHETDDDTWERMLNLNLASAFYISREVISRMRESGGGRLIAIGSLAVEPRGYRCLCGNQDRSCLADRTIALENADKNITANVILPGTMDTPTNRAAMPKADPSKWVQPADVAKVVLLLASDAGAQINGALIPISRE